MSDLLLDEARQMVERLKLFAQPQRLVILDVLLRHGPLAVGELETRTGIGQPTLSQQLGTLRRAEIVVPRRESRTIFYSIASDDDVLRVRALIALLRGDDASLPVLEAVTARYGSRPRDVSRHEAEGGAQFAFIRGRKPRVPENPIQKRLVLARNGQDPRVIGRMESGWLVLADTQPLAGYCILMADPDVESLNAMPEAARLRYLSDTVRVGDALLQVTGAERINYETWCNLAPSLHTHIVPRYAHEAPTQRVLPMCVAYDVASARPFDGVADAPLMNALRKLLDITPAGV